MNRNFQFLQWFKFKVTNLGAISICRIAFPDRQKPANPSHPHKQTTTIAICVQSRNPTANAHGADRMRPVENYRNTVALFPFQKYIRANWVNCCKVIYYFVTRVTQVEQVESHWLQLPKLCMNFRTNVLLNPLLSIKSATVAPTNVVTNMQTCGIALYIPFYNDI